MFPESDLRKGILRRFKAGGYCFVWVVLVDGEKGIHGAVVNLQGDWVCVGDYLALFDQ